MEWQCAQQQRQTHAGSLAPNHSISLGMHRLSDSGTKSYPFGKCAQGSDVRRLPTYNSLKYKYTLQLRVIPLLLTEANPIVFCSPQPLSNCVVDVR